MRGIVQHLHTANVMAYGAGQVWVALAGCIDIRCKPFFSLHQQFVEHFAQLFELPRVQLIRRFAAYAFIEKFHQLCRSCNLSRSSSMARSHNMRHAPLDLPIRSDISLNARPSK